MGVLYNKSTILYFINEFWESITLLGTPVFYIVIILIISQQDLLVDPVVVLTEFLLLEILGFLLKMIIPKKRPNNSTKRIFINTYEDRSFPSIHSARVSFLAFILCTILPELALFFTMMVVLVGYSRIYFRKHDFVDVFGGIFLGLFIGIIWKTI